MTATNSLPGDLAAYLGAFDQIEADHHQLLALVQLTTDTSRSDAHRFYEQLGSSRPTKG